ncbi:MAG: hypothetical protein ABI847_20050 [Anaerolineales bacterium]
MFDQLLEKSIAEGTDIAVAIGQQADEPVLDPATTEGPIAARKLFADPEHVDRLVVKMLVDKTCPWW